MAFPGTEVVGRLRSQAARSPALTHVVALAGLTVTMVTLLTLTGNAVYSLGLVPAIAVGWLLGTRHGAVSGVLVGSAMLVQALVVGWRGLVPLSVGLVVVAFVVLSAAGAVAGYFGSLDQRWRDELAARLDAERTLVERELTLARLVAELPAVVWATDGDLRLTVVQGRALVDLGIDPETLVGRTLAEVVPASSEAVDVHRRSLTGESTSAELVLDGRTFDTHVVPLRDAQGRIDGTLGVGIDITDRAEVAQALATTLERERQLIDELREVDEMKNAFIQAVSHELRTPLTSLRGFATTLQRNGERLSEEQKALLLDRIAVNADKLHRLLGDLLDVDRLSRGIMAPRRQRTDLGELVLRILDETDFGDRPLHTRISAVVAHVDGPKVERIVENLVANALKHTPRGTPLTVSVEEVEGGVGLCVRQAGVPVPDHLKVEIFQPFRQGPLRNAHAPGTGIGLALVTRFAELHGGSAWVEDTPDGGAAFCVFLPHHPPELEGIEVHHAGESRSGEPTVRR